MPEGGRARCFAGFFGVVEVIAYDQTGKEAGRIEYRG